MMRPIWLHVFALCALMAPAVAAAGPEAHTTEGKGKEMKAIQAGSLRITLDRDARITGLFDAERKRECLPSGQAAPLLTVVAGGEILTPASATCNEEAGRIKIVYGERRVVVGVRMTVKPTHATFEVASITGKDRVDSVVWGPYPTTIGETIGEIVGVVRTGEFAIGIQALSRHTLAGYPGQPEGLGVGGRDHAATAAEWGSALQAHSVDRTVERRRPGWNATDSIAPAYGGDGATVVGSKIALFGCAAEKALATIGEIELAEALPHPMLDGQWGKVSETARVSYLIAPFGETNLDALLDYTRKAGFKYLYHPDPFETWGRFKLRSSDFPDGDESLKRCSERAAKVGVRLGLHTLTNFITPNDPYVSPTPDARLMRVGSSRLKADVDAEATEIEVEEIWPFRERQTLSTAAIGQELVQYGSLSEKEPWRLLDCKRGAFGTQAAPHAAGEAVGKLWDHPYKVFFPNLEMQNELVDRLLEIYNKANIRQISFDGLEGCKATGQGVFAETLFVGRSYDGWKPEVVNDASRLSHYLWHVHTRMNWGEPWGKAMREGMTDYRFRNQASFDRNLFPRMLGWFQLRLASSKIEATHLMDIEWMLSKAAGYDSGFAISTDLESLQGDGQTDACLAAVREWEKARLARAFSEDQVRRLKEPAGEFHLEPEEGGWRLWPVSRTKVFTHHAEERQPGEPTATTMEVENPFAAQPLRFVLRVGSGGGPEGVRNPSFEVGIHTATFPVALEPRQYLLCDGETEAKVYDADWNLAQTVKADSAIPSLAKGKQTVLFDCEAAGGLAPAVEVWFKAVGEGEPVRSGN
ncbi:MAG TPA: hypothetical protein VM492_08935 [Sumerlaeia bacterium]|nr:hypothetical protein [Sumerlaeia bacterium]